MATSAINSVMKLLLPQTVDLSLPGNVRAQVETIINALQQLQGYIEQYCGLTQKITSQWSQLTPADTLLAHQLNRIYVKAGENLNYGSMVNIYSNSGVLTARKASAANNTMPALGWCSIVGGVAAGSYCECILGSGLCQGVSGMTAGTRYFLSVTSGIITPVEPTAVGNIGQYIGYALDANTLLVGISMQFIQH